MTRKYTPWFPGCIKPSRPGIYQQKSGDGKLIGYQRWDGGMWHSWCHTPEFAARVGPAAIEFQNDPWRGLAKDPGL